MSTRSERAPGAYDPAYDGIRAVAIILVMVSHFTNDAPAVPTMIHAFASSGWIGVDLFFVLSGFLITGICLDNAGLGFFRAFYLRRALRILPPYATVLVIILLGDFAFSPHSIRNAWALPTFMTNLIAASAGSWSALPTATWHLWSLAVEEQFYLLWPCVTVLCSRRTLVVVALSAIPLALLIRVALFIGGAKPLAPYVLMPARIDALGAGALLATLMRDSRARDTISRAIAGVAAAPIRRWIAGLLAVCLTVSALAPGVERYSRFMETIGFTAIAAAAALAVAAVAFAQGSTPLRRALSRRYPVMIGRYSYAMYLIHVPLNRALRSMRFRPVGAVSGIALIIFGSAVTFGLASLSWRVVEAPMLSLKRYVPYRNPELAVTMRDGLQAAAKPDLLRTQ